MRERAEQRIARQIAALLEHASGIATPEEQFEHLLQKARALAHDIPLETYLNETLCDQARLQGFIEGMCTHETRFFRHPEQFEIAARLWVPARQAAGLVRPVRAWSVACSSGEEPFSLAMWLLDNFPTTLGWRVEVLGTDVSQRILKRAKHATWPLARAGEISPERLDRYMLRGHDKQAGLMRATPALRAVVRLQQLNLMQQPYMLGDDFDLVFMRNVLIYFASENRQRVLTAVVSRMAPGALLVAGPSEGVSYLKDARLKAVAPHTYSYQG